MQISTSLNEPQLKISNHNWQWNNAYPGRLVQHSQACQFADIELQAQKNKLQIHFELCRIDRRLSAVLSPPRKEIGNTMGTKKDEAINNINLNVSITINYISPLIENSKNQQIFHLVLITWQVNYLLYVLFYFTSYWTTRVEKYGNVNCYTKQTN